MFGPGKIHRAVYHSSTASPKKAHSRMDALIYGPKAISFFRRSRSPVIASRQAAVRHRMPFPVCRYSPAIKSSLRSPPPMDLRRKIRSAAIDMSSVPPPRIAAPASAGSRSLIKTQVSPKRTSAARISLFGIFRMSMSYRETASSRTDRPEKRACRAQEKQ